MNNKKKAVVILSGGMDSTTLLYDILHKGYEVSALSFDYCQKHAKELEYAQKTCKKLGVNWQKIDLNVLGAIAPSALTRSGWDVPEGHYENKNMKQTVVPNRNMVMLSLATSFAISIKADFLFYGAHAGDHAIYPDCRSEFILAMRKSIKLCDWHKVQLLAPYKKITKGDIAKIGKKLGVDYSLTWTCYKGKEKACGRCGSCRERVEAFEYANMEDPLDYEWKKIPLKKR